ncbi:hypothetical protein BRADI_4g24731v3 [Brachypodium distachyon]|uniref:Uncharacterized protein n=1 Tax=Brachypodium distachyon TaxID=15368 RepID=A0A2K2CQ11_BRADI|nr:hypothetical protein BRADI_4g24731v3 [Brachypodium distachyon]
MNHNANVINTAYHDAVKWYAMPSFSRNRDALLRHTFRSPASNSLKDPSTVVTTARTLFSSSSMTSSQRGRRPLKK